MPKVIDRISQHTFLPNNLNAGSVVVDLGVNRGCFSRGIHRRYGCHVIGVEPIAEVVEPLPASITVLSAAIAADPGTRQIAIDPANLQGSSIVLHGRDEKAGDRKARLRTVPAITLTEIFSRFRLSRIDLLKMDVEGAEIEVLGSADADLLKRCAQITVEYHDLQHPDLSEPTAAVRERLRSLGFHEIRFTLDNRDVLYFNPDLVSVSWLRRWYIRTVLKYLHGARRAARILLRRTIQRPRPI